MTKTKLELLGEQMMVEIKENKKWNERAVTNEALDQKLDIVLEVLHDTRNKVIKLEERIDRIEARMDEVEKQVYIIKDILQDHTKRLRRLEDRQ
jgi:BMFP domain-containing protein YqiC